MLTPVDGKVEIDVQGDLAGILMISAQTKNPAGERGGSQLKMVAGAGVDHNLRSTPTKMVAGACIHLHLLFRTAA
ncbi:hypothetical protein CN883_10610 [Ochrobactrum sp. 27A/999/2015]|nr:hypothetical protein CN883_10610 [Ochrobactrum sp. 27A/999/2015]